MSFVLVGIPLALIYKQPDTSTTIAIALIFVSLLFIAGLSYKIVLTVLGICIPVGIIGISMILRKALSGDGDYRYGRIMSWLYPKDPRWSDIAAQQQNSIMAIGSGQLWGKGLNNSVATSMKTTGIKYIVEGISDAFASTCVNNPAPFINSDKVFTPQVDKKPIPVLAGWKFRLDKKENFKKSRKNK